MPLVPIELSCPIHDSFRVRQVAGLFDVPLAQRAIEKFEIAVPDLDGPWRIGLIVGPSGSGKTSLARAWLGAGLQQRRPWRADRAVVDCFGERPIKQVTGLLTAVGFGSPPSWIKPYAVLSRGEQFRCDLALALADDDFGLRISDCGFAKVEGSSPVASIRNPQSEIRNPPPPVVFDEFSSSVDRTVARTVSAAVARALRGGRIDRRFVAVTCHADVAEWLEPDWIVDTATRDWRRGRLRRPAIRLQIVRATRHAWPPFARHHYLSGQLSGPARCYLALWDQTPVAFCALLPTIGRRGRWRITRLVTLPDYQGIGIGMRVAEGVAELYRDEGQRVSITASHPAVVAHCSRSPRWGAARLLKTGSRRPALRREGYRASLGRAMASFEYLGESA